MARRLGKVAWLGVLIVAGCSGGSLFGNSDDGPKLEGERISVLDLESTLQPDSEIAGEQVQLPEPYVNQNWSQAGGTASHAMYHLALPGDLDEAWRADTGTGVRDSQPLLAQPVVADARLFTMGAGQTVRAFDTANGERLWSRALNTGGNDDGAFGGGLAVADGRVFATTGFGAIFALDADSGEVLWRHETRTPIRGAPTVVQDKLFAVNIVNQTLALSLDAGEALWTHQGIEEQAGLIGSASPAASESSVVSAYSSGQLFALLNDNGRVLWNDGLAGISRTSRVSDMADIRGLPVLDRGRVVAASNSGRMVAVDLRSGARAWEVELASTETPWAGGDYFYVVTPEARVAAIRRRDGKIRWVTEIAAYEDMTEKTGPIYWHGPVLAGDRLILAGSHGTAVSLSPYTGEFLGRTELPGPPAVPPLVADETLYFLTEDATLLAFR